MPLSVAQRSSVKRIALAHDGPRRLDETARLDKELAVMVFGARRASGSPRDLVERVRMQSPTFRRRWLTGTLPCSLKRRSSGPPVLRTRDDELRSFCQVCQDRRALVSHASFDEIALRIVAAEIERRPISHVPFTIASAHCSARSTDSAELGPIGITSAVHSRRTKAAIVSRRRSSPGSAAHGRQSP